ncbi:calcium-binding and coiled-coil domain-containing protein 2 isoform X3 [Ascaphus truei]|uniref:calcium-binding and coiled-coil domain-containing protein 2 isoform X3 n=1 Tax=Ascaphus truei TaxID=8439 RepID=UPI003F5AD556
MDPVSHNLSDCPPTSATLPEIGNFSQVTFDRVRKFHEPGTDVTCYFTLSHLFQPRKNDWLGIFKVGWKTTREYFTFMWTPAPSEDGNAEKQIQFKAYYLPKDKEDYYQFCYVDQDGVVRGASIPFQFCREMEEMEEEEDILVVTTEEEARKTKEQSKKLVEEKLELKAKVLALEGDLSRLQDQVSSLQKDRAYHTGKVEALHAKLLASEEHHRRLEQENKVELEKQAPVSEQLQRVTEENEQLHSSLAAQKQGVLDMEQRLAQAQEQQQSAQERALALQQQLAQQQKENLLLLRRLETGNHSVIVRSMELDDLRAECQRKKEEIDELHSLLSEKQLSAPGSQNTQLYFPNPYREHRPSYPDSEEHQGPGSSSSGSSRSPGTRECPQCGQLFPERDLQVFNDHLLCHELDSDAPPLSRP